jgi:hypothetical protein
MNFNSLIIVADASSARLFRTAQTNDPTRPVELIEVASVRAGDSATSDTTRATPEAAPGPARAQGSLFQRVADLAAAFAQYHFCSPIIVAAEQDAAPELADALVRHLPNVPVRPIHTDMAGWPANDVLRELQRREAFTAPRYPTRGS